MKRLVTRSTRGVVRRAKAGATLIAALALAFPFSCVHAGPAYLSAGFARDYLREMLRCHLVPTISASAVTRW